MKTFIREFKSLRPYEKILFSFFLLCAGWFLFYHGFVHAGIITLPPRRAVDCTGVATPATHEIVMEHNAFIPSELTVKACDILRFVNHDEALHEPAAGPHPTHASYPELDAKRPLQKGEMFEVVLNRPGTFSFHDHLNEEMVGTLIILK